MKKKHSKILVGPKSASLSDRQKIEILISALKYFADRAPKKKKITENMHEFDIHCWIAKTTIDRVR